MNAHGSPESYRQAVQQLIGLLYADTPLQVIEQRACDLACETLEAECTFLGIASNGKSTLAVSSCSPDKAGSFNPSPKIDEAVASGNRVYDENGAASVTVPIPYGDQIIGALSAYDGRRSRFLEPEADALEAFGQYVALARGNYSNVNDLIHRLRLERRAIWFLVLLALLACAALGLYGFVSARANAAHVADNARIATDVSNDHLDRYVASGEQLAATAAAIAPSLRGNKQRAEGFLKTLLGSTPFAVIYGTGLWYKPYAFSPHIRLFGPFAHRAGNGRLVITYQWSHVTYNYLKHQWYRSGLRARTQAAITDPYFDKNHVYISAVHNIRAGAESIGVATVDTTSDAIDTYLRRVSRPEHFSYLTTLDHHIVAFPHASQLLEFARSKHPAKTILDVTEADANAFISMTYPETRVVTHVRALRIPVILVNSWTASELGRTDVPIGLLVSTAVFVWLITLSAIFSIRRSRIRGFAALDMDKERTRLSLELQARVAAEQALRKAADLDTLTGVANRTAIMTAINQSIEAAKEGKRNDAIVFIDLNGFERINSMYGHVAGDHVLIEFGALLRRCARPDDLPARLGGDEFAMLVRENGLVAARAVGENLQSELAKALAVGGEAIFLDAGIGIAEISADYARAEDVIRDADYAMYEAKRSGRAAIVAFDPALREAAAHQRELQAALRGAVERREITVLYQPMYRLADRTLVGFEALIRWDRPGQPQMNPAQFLPVAEHSGIILTLDRYVAQTACLQLSQWQHTAPHLRMAVNASALHFGHAAALRELLAALRVCPTEPNTLDVELTESALMGLTRDAIGTVRELHAVGIRLHLDDFGTGYSSLSYLQHLHVDALKIDRTFVQSMLHDERSMQIVNAIISLAHGLRVEIVAEGVENESQARALAHLGVTMGQGYLFGAPMAAQDAERLI